MEAQNGHVVPHWSSRWGFVLAATGAAVGLGNFWKFPYMVSEGGGAFVLLYILFLVAMMLPLFLAELILGRTSRQNPIFATRVLVEHEVSVPNPVWKYLGWAMTITGLLILSYYSVIAGLILAYTLRTAVGIFEQVETIEGIRSTFSLFISDPEKLLAWHTVFVLMTVCISGRDFRRGVENTARLIVPSMFVLLLIMVFYGVTTPIFSESLVTLFDVDFSVLTFSHVTQAMQFAFFSLSLGVGVMLVFGAYLDRDTSIFPLSIMVVVFDTAAALLAVLLIYPVVVGSELELSSGLTLIFQTLPMAFNTLPGGAYWGTLFFVVLVMAAWTSAIALLEPSVAWLRAKYDWSRAKAAIVTGLLVWFLGLFNILSLNYWAFEFKFLGTQMVNGWLDMMDIVTASILLPLIALLVAVFTGWIMSRDYARQQLGSSILGYRVWLMLIRFAVPCLVVIVSVYRLFY